MLNLPYRWFANVVALLEKREYSPYNVLFFCIFVGCMRMLEEWALGGRSLLFAMADGMVYVSFYWLAYHLYGLVLRVLVPRQPWRRSINVVLIGIFLGLLPPLIDVFVFGLGNPIPYRYVRDFPGGWNLTIYNPQQGIPLGEAVVLWTTIFFTAFYVHYKTRSLWRGLAAVVLAYGVVVTIGALVATAATNFVDALQWGRGHLAELLTFGQWLLPLVAYLALRPALAGHLARRALHAVPFVLTSLAGAAFAGGLGAAAGMYAALLLLGFLTALIQNDYFDAAEDANQGRPVIVERIDLQFFTVIAWGSVIILGLAGTAAAAILAVVLGLSHLYSYPDYRAKRYFPANLKIEGMWGLLSFLLGLLAAAETGALGGPRLAPFGGTPEALNKFRALRPAELVAALLVFGGFSLLAALKDAKDVAADREAGNQTVYTLALKRGISIDKVHAFFTLAAPASLALGAVLIVAGGHASPVWLAPGMLFAVLAWYVLAGASKAAAFRNFLWVVSGYLLTLTGVLAWGAK